MPKTWYMTNATGNGYQELSETAPGSGTSSPNVGWTVAKVAASNFSDLQAGTERASGTFGATVLPGTTFVTSRGFRTDAFTISFTSANWTFTFEVTAVSAAAGQDGRFGLRMWRSVNADGTSATQITSARQVTTSFTDLGTGATTEISVTFNPGAFSLANEFLFVALAHEITGASTSNSADVILRIGANETRIVSAPFAQTVSPSDSVSVTDAIARTATFGRTPSDSVSVTDATTRSTNTSRSLSDSISATDTSKINLTRTQAINDTITVSDSSASSASFGRITSDSASVSDSVTAEIFTSGISVDVSDSISVTDATNRTADFGRSGSDSASATDSSTINLTRDQAVSDTITVGDSSATAASYERLLSDSATITDSVSVSTALAIFASDAISVSDSSTINLTRDQSVSDTITVGDDASTAAEYARSVSDAVSAIDSVTAQISAAAIERTVSDAINATDALVVNFTRNQSIDDVVTVDDGALTAASYSRTSSDAVSVTDSVTAQIVGLITVELSDSISITDALAVQKIGVHDVVGGDVIGVGDSTSVDVIRPRPPVPPKPPKPKPKKRPSQPSTSFSGGSASAGLGADFLLNNLLEQLANDVCEPSAPLVVVEQPQRFRPPPPREVPRQLVYIDNVDQSQRHTHNFVENDQRVMNFNFAPLEDSTLRTVLLIALGVGLAALIWSIATASQRPARPPRREDAP